MTTNMPDWATEDFFKTLKAALFNHYTIRESCRKTEKLKDKSRAIYEAISLYPEFEKKVHSLLRARTLSLVEEAYSISRGADPELASPIARRLAIDQINKICAFDNPAKYNQNYYKPNMRPMDIPVKGKTAAERLASILIGGVAKGIIPIDIATEWAKTEAINLQAIENMEIKKAMAELQGVVSKLKAPEVVD